MQFRANVDVRSLERVRLLAVELELLEGRLVKRLGETHEFTVDIHRIRQRFLADLVGDKLEEDGA